MAAFHMALEDETDSAEWVAFCRVAVRQNGWKFLPSVPELVDALHEFRGEPALEPEASRAYEAVIASGTYTPEGTVWVYRTVLERCGRAAAEAFQAAGAHHAFASTWAEDKRRERFIGAYIPAARAEPQSRLLPASTEPQKALPAGPQVMPPSDIALVRKIAALSGEEGLAPEEQGGTVVRTPERDAQLEAQKAAILTGEKAEVPA